MNNGDIVEVGGKKYKAVVLDNDEMISRVIKTMDIYEMCKGCAGETNDSLCQFLGLCYDKGTEPIHWIFVEVKDE